MRTATARYRAAFPVSVRRFPDDRSTDCAFQSAACTPVKESEAANQSRRPGPETGRIEVGKPCGRPRDAARM